jgi:hypothetical protein
MKKFLVVLTILVLVAGFAFATVTGSVEARYKFDFSDGKTKTLTYGIWGTHSKVSFSLSTDKGGVDGSNKPYAVVAVDLTLSATAIDATTTAAQLKYDGASKATYHYVDFDGDIDLAVALKLSDFRIVGENWEINFLKAIGVGDYAKSAWEIDDTDDEKALDAPWAFKAEEGITVTYADYKVGVRAVRGTDGVLVANVRTETKDLTFAEGVTGKAAVGIGLGKKGSDDMTFDFGASVKAGYATDALTVDGAVDLQYVAKDFDLDAAVKVAVKPVTVDAYFATKLQKQRLHGVFANPENVLSVRVIVDLDPVKVTVYGENLLNNDRLLAVKEEGTFGALKEDAQFGILPSLGNENNLGNVKAGFWFANAGVGYDVMENLNVNAHVGYERLYYKADAADKLHLSGLAIQVGAVYKLEVAKITADVYLGKEFGDIVLAGESYKYDEDLRVAFVVGAESDKLVENAVLSAKLNIDKYGVVGLYKSTRAVDDFNDALFNYDSAQMSFQVACKVTF